MNRQDKPQAQGVPSETSRHSVYEQSASSISKSFVRQITSSPPGKVSPTPTSAPSPPLSISLDVLESNSRELTEGSVDTKHINPSLSDYLSLKPPAQDTLIDTSMDKTHRQTGDNGSYVSQMSSQQFEQVDYHEVDSEQKLEYEELLKKETSWQRTCLHKGLIVNLLFLVVMVVSIILGEVFFPLEGVRGEKVSLNNDSNCLNHRAECFSLRIIRGMGVFGFIGGVTNWIAVEILFRSIPFVIGTGIIAKGYKEIRQSICQLVVETLFDPVGLRQYFSSEKSVRKMLHLETHFGSLLSSESANRIIESKIDSALKRPEGFVLAMMGVDHGELKMKLQRHIHLFLSDISPAIQDRLVAPGLRDGVELQREVQKIFEERLKELSSTKVNQLVAIMIRKHLSWLIVWGNIMGATVGLLAEVIAIVVSK